MTRAGTAADTREADTGEVPLPWHRACILGVHASTKLGTASHGAEALERPVPARRSNSMTVPVRNLLVDRQRSGTYVALLTKGFQSLASPAKAEYKLETGLRLHISATTSVPSVILAL
jgi:hypothetical protein